MTAVVDPIETTESDTGLARSATILSLGNVASRALGLVRETVIAGYFGATGAVSAFRLSARVPTMICLLYTSPSPRD